MDDDRGEDLQLLDVSVSAIFYKPLDGIAADLQL